MSRSLSVNWLNGTSVRTPMARQTSVITDHISVFHGNTAPWSMVNVSSGTKVDSSTVRTVPVPSHVGQAPLLLNESSSAEGAKKCVPHSGQINSCPAATFNEGAR